ncbi:MAG: hypothetical protein ACQXXK_05300 [Methanothrix sp.]
MRCRKLHPRGDPTSTGIERSEQEIVDIGFHRLKRGSRRFLLCVG